MFRQNPFSFCCWLFVLSLWPGISAIAQTDLVPYAPSGWSDKIVVTTNGNTTGSSAGEGSGFLATNTLYVNWCVINSGSSSATTPFYVYLYVDGVYNQEWEIGSLPPSYYTYADNYAIGSLSAGSHSIEIVADATKVYSQSPASYTKTISVGAVTLLAPTPITPTNNSAGQTTVPWFSWSQVAQAGSYRVLVATNAADLPSSPTASNGGPSVVIDAVTPTNNFSPTIQLAASTTYYWEVHGIAGGDDGTWSAAQTFTTGPIPNGLTIIPTFDSSITNDPQAATIEATINAAIAVYRFNFSDRVTANFTFTEMDSGLGENDTYEVYESYGSYRAALVSHATTPDDATALAYLPTQTDNPVNGNAQMTLKLPLARALGFSANPSSGDSDSTVYLNTSVMNLSSLATSPTNYSLFATVSHEMDEALGLGSALNGLANNAAAPTGPVMPQDLFRYDQNGNRSLTTSLTATAYFSLDGTNDLAQFNQFDGGDFGDWYSYDVTVTPQVQDAFLGPGVNPVLGVELRVLDVMGFTRVTNSAVALPSAAQLSGARTTAAAAQFIFSYSGTAGDPYVAEYSTNLLTWTPFATNTVPVSGQVSVTNIITGQPHRYYRVVGE
jgi:hypothetical protein